MSLCAFISSDGRAVTDGRYGPVLSDVWVNEAECNGSEPYIVNCSVSNSNSANCTEAAGVVCSHQVESKIP